MKTYNARCGHPWLGLVQRGHVLRGRGRHESALHGMHKHNVSSVVVVLDLVSQVRDVVLMNVYLDLGNSGGSGFWNEEYIGKRREMGRPVYEQPGNEVDGSCHSEEGSK